MKITKGCCTDIVVGGELLTVDYTLFEDKYDYDVEVTDLWSEGRNVFCEFDGVFRNGLPVLEVIESVLREKLDEELSDFEGWEEY